MITVVLLDDHEVVRQGLAALLESAGDIEVVGQCATAAEAVPLITELRPDVAVLDLRLPDGSGIEVCRELRVTAPEVRCLLFTSFGDDRALIEAGAAGAAGYIVKEVRGNDIVASVRAVAEGRVLLDDAEIRMAWRRYRREAEGRVATLTPQERRIFELIGEGRSNQEIADEMHLAVKTVKNYTSSLFTKLGILRRTEAAAIAARMAERAELLHLGDDIPEPPDA
ncbi:MAG: DNA-binding response regulator [Actinomyces sp.]|nr:MAG: DNA-binding response regulator [Actinomyces sp.]